MAPAVKDSNAPKRPLSAYIAWQGSAREAIVKTMPEGYSFGDLAKKFSTTWKEMAEAEKAPFENKAKAEMEKYHQAMEKYKLTDNYKKFQETKAQSKVDAVKKSKFRKDENAPKRPANGYFLFMQSKKDELTAEGLAFTEVSKKCGALWNGYSEAEKKPWEDKAAAAKAKYDADLAKYQTTANYKKYMEEKAAFEANKKADLKKAKGEPEKKEPSAKKVKASKSRSRSTSKKPRKSKSRSKKRSRSRSRSRSKKVKKSKSRSRSKKRSRSKSKKAKKSKSRSRSKKRSRSRSRSRPKKKKSKSRSRSRKPKAAKRKSKSRSRKRSRSARRASKPKAPKSSARKAAKPKAAKSKSRSRSRKRSCSRSAKKAKKAVPKKDAAPQ